MLTSLAKPLAALAAFIPMVLAGSAFAQIAVEQDSGRNKLLIQQKGSNGNAPEKEKVFETGNSKNSVMHVQQRSDETDAVAATQAGETNTIRANQRAGNNSLSATQTGGENTAIVRQTQPK